MIATSVAYLKYGKTHNVKVWGVGLILSIMAYIGLMIVLCNSFLALGTLPELQENLAMMALFPIICFVLMVLIATIDSQNA